MRDKCRTIAAILTALLIFSMLPVYSRAGDGDGSEEWTKSKESGNTLVYDDKYDVLDKKEKKALLKLMDELSIYGNVCFVTDSEPGIADESDADRKADAYYYERFEDEDGLLLLFDYDEGYTEEEHCMMWMVTYGALEKKIRPSKCNTILDNAYNNNSYHDWYGSAASSFQQAYDLLETGRLAEPMKYISNIFLALILGLLINFIIAMWSIRSRIPGDDEVLLGLFQSYKTSGVKLDYVGTTRTYSPQSSSSGGGRSGGGGGGGHSHSGGGHRA